MHIYIEAFIKIYANEYQSEILEVLFFSFQQSK